MQSELLKVLNLRAAHTFSMKQVRSYGELLLKRCSTMLGGVGWRATFVNKLLQQNAFLALEGQEWGHMSALVGETRDKTQDNVVLYRKEWCLLSRQRVAMIDNRDL